MNYKSYLLLFLVLIFKSQYIFAQERVIIKLNQFMVPIQDEREEEHHFNQIISTNDVQIISKTYDLENRLIIQTKESFKEEEGFKEEITSTYDTLQNLISSEIKNLDNGSFVKVFLDEVEVVSKLSFLDGKNYQFFLRDMEKPYLEGELNPMLPKLKLDEKSFFRALSKNLNYPQEARNMKETGTVWVGMIVDENGKVLDYYCMNPEYLHPSLISEAIRCMKKINPEFDPGIDHFGNPATAKFRIPIRFKLS